MRKAADARVGKQALVQDSEGNAVTIPIPSGTKKTSNLDLRNRHHLDWVLRDAVADEIALNPGLQEAARAVALGRFNKSNGLVVTSKQTQRTFKSLLSQAMAMPNIQEAYKTLLENDVNDEGVVSPVAYNNFLYDVRQMLVGNLEDETLAGMYDVLRSLGRTR